MKNKYCCDGVIRSILVIATFFTGINGNSQSVAEFVSMAPAAQTEVLKIPCSHSFQMLVKEGQILSDGTNLPSSSDFTAYFETSPNQGILTINHENIAGAVTRHNIQFDTVQQLWSLGTSGYVNFADVVGTYRPCSGGVSPWGTLFCGEEYVSSADANSDGYLDAGWLYEVDPMTGLLMDPDSNGVRDKNWAMGRMVHENVCFSPDSTTAYYGVDNAFNGYLFKFVASQKGNFGDGLLYVLKKPSLLSPDGDWIQVPNSTPHERDSVINYSVAIGATNFNRIEDVEVGPDNKVYFAATSNGRIYRFNDMQDSIANFEIFVNNQFYTVQSVSGPVSFAWGAGMDNLCFDNEGNLWVLQDGGAEYILVVGSNHTTSNPNIRIFGQMPIGAEPTGINFSPDYRFLFMSVMHPDVSNVSPMYDASGTPVVFNKSVTIVIARREYLGQSIDAQILGIPQDVCMDSQPLGINVNAYSGFLSGSGVNNDTLFADIAGIGDHNIVYNYPDSTGCELYADFMFSVHGLPTLSLFTDSLYCYQDSIVSLSANYSGVTYIGSGINPDGTFNIAGMGSGYHQVESIYVDEFGCADSDTAGFNISVPVYPSFSGLDSSYCSNALADSVSIAPAGSFVLSGVGLVGTLFVPSLADPLSELILKYVDTLGCVTTDTTYVIINEPEANFISGLPASVCQNEDPFLPVLVPSGGILGGSGVTAGLVDPSLMSAGVNDIYYTTSDSNGCSFTSQASVFVIVPSPVYAGSDKQICYGDLYQLTGFPASGAWFGPGIESGDWVNSNFTGIGTFEYYLVNQDNNGCSNQDTMLLVVSDCLGIEEADLSNISVYPNPMTENFWVRTYVENESNVRIVLMDASGKQLWVREFEQLAPGDYSWEFNNENLDEGLYLLMLTINDEESVVRLIKSN